MTQAQFAQWLGVSIKQVKYLEHQRRNPSGPTRRLLDILASRQGFEVQTAVQVLATPFAQPRPPAILSHSRRPETTREAPPVDAAMDKPVEGSMAEDLDAQESPAVPADDAFVWS